MRSYRQLREGKIALYIDNQRYSFNNVPESPNLYVHMPLTFLHCPWKRLTVVVGSSVCYKGYLYFYETNKHVKTEFGELAIKLMFQETYPFYNHHFILKASVV